MLAFDEQSVRWYWCMFELECVIAWCTMHHDTITIACPAAMQTHYNGDATSYTTLCTMLLFEYMQRYCVEFGLTGSTLVLVHV